MKLLVVLSVIACSYAAQLDRGYLPPPGATAAGGSPGSLTGPLSPSDQGFGPSSAPGLNQPAGTPGSLGQPAAQYGPPSGPSGSPIGSIGFATSQTGRASSLGSYDQGRSYQYQPERARAALDRNAETLRYDNRIDGDTFAYSFETSNGITAEESGIATNGVQAQGGYSYTADDGQIYRISYTADENGYQPRGDHLPTSPPIPEEILRSIEENARAAAAGTQEGAYNPNEDNLQYSQQYTNSAFNDDSGYQYNTPASGISRSDNGALATTATQGGYTGSSNQGAIGSQSGYQAPGSQNNGPGSAISGSVNLQAGNNAGYQTPTPTQQYNAPNAAGGAGSYNVNRGTFGAVQPGKTSSRPDNQYIPPVSGQRYNPSGSSQTAVQIGAKQYNTPSNTAARPVASPTASGPSPSAFAPSGSTAGPTNPTSYTSSSPSISPFAVSNTPPSGFAPSGPTSSGPTQSAFTPSGTSTSGFTSSSPSVAPARNNAPSSTGVQISEYSKAGQVTPQQTDDGYNYNRPQPGFGESRTSQAVSQRPSSGSNQGFIINVPGSSGSAPTSQGQYQPNQTAGKRFPMQAGYEYDRPGTQPGVSGAGGVGKSDDRRSGQTFGGPRQPPSFSQDEGYKY